LARVRIELELVTLQLERLRDDPARILLLPRLQIDKPVQRQRRQTNRRKIRMPHVAVGPAGVVEPVLVLVGDDARGVVEDVLVERTLAAADNQWLLGVDPRKVPIRFVAAAAGGEVTVPNVPLVPPFVPAGIDLR